MGNCQQMLRYILPCSANRLANLLHRKELKRDGHADTAPHQPLAALPSLVGHVIISLPIHHIFIHKKGREEGTLASFRAGMRGNCYLSKFRAGGRKQQRNRRAIAEMQAELAISVVSRGCLWLP